MASSSTSATCQICKSSEHIALGCPILDTKCKMCRNTMVLLPSDRCVSIDQRVLSCTVGRCAEFISIAQVMDAIRKANEPAKELTPPTQAPRCFHCSETTHESLLCPWKNLKCSVKDCPGTLWIRAASLEGNNFGRKFLQCECCYDDTWMDEYDYWKGRREHQKNIEFNRKLKEIVNNARKHQGGSSS